MISLELLMKKKENQVRVEGIVIPVNWDEKGNIVNLALATNTEEELLISNDLKGLMLRKYTQEKVELTGEIIEVAGVKMIRVQDIQSSS
jgi:hypothetical protein